MTAPAYAPAPPADPTAVVGRRIVAWLLDLLVWMAIGIAMYGAQAEYVDIPEGMSADACTILQDVGGDEATGCIALGDKAYVISSSEAGVQTLVSVGYLVGFVVLQGVTGGSPGKLVVGLRVVTPDGQIAGIGRSFVRTLLWVVDGAPWLVPLVGLITGLTSSGHRRVGDMVAKTHVVARSSVGLPVTAVAAAPPPGGAWGAPPAASSPWPTPAAPPAAATTWDLPAAPPVSEPTIGADTPPPVEPDTGADDDAAASDSSGTGFVAPGAAAPAAATEPVLPAPQWDAARNTYIQWDPRTQAWLQWDTTGNAWKPIDT